MSMSPIHTTRYRTFQGVRYSLRQDPLNIGVACEEIPVPHYHSIQLTWSKRVYKNAIAQHTWDNKTKTYKLTFESGWDWEVIDCKRFECSEGAKALKIWEEWPTQDMLPFVTASVL